MIDQFDSSCTVNGELFELQEVKVFEDNEEARAFISHHFKSGHFTLEGTKNGKRCVAVYVPATYDGGLEVLDLTGEMSDSEFFKRTWPVGATVTALPQEGRGIKKGLYE
ncbi:MAG: hypothetical protein AAFP82_00440 [Bacteroidota bacterium]